MARAPSTRSAILSKWRSAGSLARPRLARVAKPLAPGPKQAPLQLAKGQHVRVAEGPLQGAEGGFEGRQDLVAFGDQPAIELQGGQHAGGHPLPVPALLLAVAVHRYLADPVGDLPFLQPQPHLLAVGTPGVVVPIEGDPDVGLTAAKQAQLGLGIGRSANPIGLRSSQGLELVPAEGGSKGEGFRHLAGTTLQGLV